MIHVTIAGHIGRDAETRKVGDDTVTSFSVASTRKLKSGDVTTWVTCSVWNARGVALAPYLKKGDPITVVGELSEREYEKDGEKRKALECRASDIALQGGKREGGEKAPSAPTKGKSYKSDADEGDPEWMHG